MKYFVVLALIAVSLTAYIKPAPVSAEHAELQAIIDAINSPSTDPATATTLAEIFYSFLRTSPQPIHIGPEIIDFPLPDGGAVSEPVKPTPSPAVVGPVALSQSSPLVQLIVICSRRSPTAAGGYAPGPVVDSVEIVPEPVIIVEETEVPEIPDPVIVDPTPVVPEPVNQLVVIVEIRHNQL
ncbi:36.4 kDa proline-rich protein-like [Bombyx mandarina]|uniref:36.4 kDa proline-rich protein-like n=1 Tax=Bombyx mandarina TaxID=7092 RepID=A0A6J2KS42_BOMMA|nr:36.4 kDa proline-rich protein-like [Bombyx mandarina]